MMDAEHDDEESCFDNGELSTSLQTHSRIEDGAYTNGRPVESQLDLR